MFERDQLWKLWEGSSRIQCCPGGAILRPGRAEIETALGLAVYRTLSVHDHHYVGAGCLPARTRTLQVIEAIADNVGRIPYIYNTEALTIDLVQGCTEPAGHGSPRSPVVSMRRTCSWPGPWASVRR